MLYRQLIRKYCFGKMWFTDYARCVDVIELLQHFQRNQTKMLLWTRIIKRYCYLWHRFQRKKLLSWVIRIQKMVSHVDSWKSWCRRRLPRKWGKTSKQWSKRIARWKKILMKLSCKSLRMCFACSWNACSIVLARRSRIWRFCTIVTLDCWSRYTQNTKRASLLQWLICCFRSGRTTTSV